jgi:diguanylate cyclase (GGDEF)-like protein
LNGRFLVVYQPNRPSSAQVAYTASISESKEGHLSRWFRNRPLSLVWSTGEQRVALVALLSAAVASTVTAGVLLSIVDGPSVAWFLALPLAAELFAALILFKERSRREEPHDPNVMPDPFGLAELERGLVDRATHDALTGLANRTLMAHHISGAIDRGGGAHLALLLIDVEQHQVIDDGSSEATVEEALDQLLVISAQRLVGALREGDLAARFGNREFAVAARVAPDGGEEAKSLGTRIVEALSRPACISGATLSVSPTVAVVLGRPFDDCSDLLNAADVGLIAAKASARGRVELVSR